MAHQTAGWKSKINNLFTTESELCRNAGLSAFQFHESMLQSDKIWCGYLVTNCVSLQTFWTPVVSYWSEICQDDARVHSELRQHLTVWIFAIQDVGQLLFLANVYVYVFTFAICHRRSVCRLSVCPSVCDVGAPYSAGWNFRNFFSPYDSPGTLVFWCQNSLVEDALFPLKFSFKVTHPLSNSEISTNIGS